MFFGTYIEECNKLNWSNRLKNIISIEWRESKKFDILQENIRYQNIFDIYLDIRISRYIFFFRIYQLL